VPTREQVRGLLDSGLDYEATGLRLGISPGQAYLIATGTAADGSDTITEDEAKRPGFLPGSQRLANPPHDNPATKDQVTAWLMARVAADGQMRVALRERTAEPPEIEAPEDDPRCDHRSRPSAQSGQLPAERTAGAAQAVTATGST
jgi:hypothetical protein